MNLYVYEVVTVHELIIPLSYHPVNQNYQTVAFSYHSQYIGAYVVFDYVRADPLVYHTDVSPADLYH